MGSDNADKHLYERVISKEDHEQSQDEILRQQVSKNKHTRRGPSSSTGGAIILKWMCFVLSIFVITSAAVIYFSDMDEAEQLRGSIKHAFHNFGDKSHNSGIHRPELEHGNSIHHNHTSTTPQVGGKESYFDRETPIPTPNPTERPTPEPTPEPTPNPTPEPTPMPATAEAEKKEKEEEKKDDEEEKKEDEEESNNKNDEDNVPVPELNDTNTVAEITAPPVTIPPILTLDENEILNENKDDDTLEDEDEDKEDGDPSKKDPELKPGGPDVPSDDDNL